MDNTLLEKALEMPPEYTIIVILKNSECSQTNCYGKRK